MPVRLRDSESRDKCALCGFGYTTSAKMFTRASGGWVCPQCVREAMLILAEERVYEEHRKKRKQLGHPYND